MADISQSRRTFIKAVALVLVAGGLLRRYLTPQLPPRNRVLVRAPKADIPAGGALLFREERIALLRHDAGFLALSLVCTHLGCTVAVTAGGLACPCHGSSFDRRGMVLKGPADRPLARLATRDDGEMIEVLEG
jgi:Rieske Fe-S protein